MIVVPAAVFTAVADAIYALALSGVPLDGLRATVRDGEVQVSDDTASYGVHHWGTV